MVEQYERCSAEIALERSRFERNLVAAVLGDPNIGVSVLQEISFDLRVIEEEDLRLIVECCQKLRRKSRGDILVFIQSQLQIHGFWDPLQRPTSESSQWSSENLLRFANSFSRTQSPVCRTEVKVRANQLLKLHAAERDCREQLNHAIKHFGEKVQWCKNQR